MSVLAVVPVAVVGLSLPVVAGLIAAPLARSGGVGWETAEGLVVGVVVLAAELVILRRFGMYVRRKAESERLSARNARIRAGLGNSVVL